MERSSDASVVTRKCVDDEDLVKRRKFFDETIARIESVLQTRIQATAEVADLL